MHPWITLGFVLMQCEPSPGDRRSYRKWRDDFHIVLSSVPLHLGGMHSICNRSEQRRSRVSDKKVVTASQGLSFLPLNKHVWKYLHFLHHICQMMPMVTVCAPSHPASPFHFYSNTEALFLKLAERTTWHSEFKWLNFLFPPLKTK
jgi:hypothetical protein